MMERENKLRFDYEQTKDQFNMLADIRFKLLAFVPTVSGAAITLLTGKQNSEVALAVGLLGFFVTLGIVFYELRNTKLYDATVHRAKCLEALLDLPVCTQGKDVGGLFNERPARTRLFGLVTVWHDRGLALVYGAAIGGWVYIIVDSIFSLLGRRSYAVSILLAVVLALLFMWEFHRLDRKGKPQPSDEIKEVLADKAN